MAKTKVLITGMSGLIGSALRTHLEGRYELSALNRSAVAGVRCHRADIRDLEAIAPAFEGQEAVVHLAAKVSSGGDTSLDDTLEFNHRGTWNVFEAARRAGCKRIVFASSGAVVAGYEGDEPYKSLVAGNYAAVKGGWPMLDHLSPIRARGLYGCSKAWGEAMARAYVDKNPPLSIVCVRIGRVNGENKASDPRTRSVWCSHRDICGLLEAAIVAPPSVRYDVVFGVSNNRYGYRDMKHAKEVLGFTPQDSADAFFKD
jgi:NAD+ dependent glucose-6-phosphate dehydrogenase